MKKSKDQKTTVGAKLAESSLISSSKKEGLVSAKQNIGYLNSGNFHQCA